MTMNSIIKQDFEGHLYSFNEAGWFNATEAAKRFSRKPSHWLELPGTAGYIAALAKALRFDAGFSGIKGDRERGELVRTSKVRGQAGTWLHPKLAVAFARWLSDDFGVWCDLQIDAIIRSGIRAEGNANLLPLLLRDSVGIWELRFKPEYYQALAKLTGTIYTGHAGGTCPLYGQITDRWVYGCLLPDEVHAELKARRSESQKMHQWLTEGGQTLLDQQINLVQSIANTSADRRDFEARMMLISGRRGQLGFVYPKAA
ncbi:KilA-N domain-containing protein [Delftia tsuruhatensis]|nr:KilA-N domain-containing protein [Delftia tsuruhatensis]